MLIHALVFAVCELVYPLMEVIVLARSLVPRRNHVFASDGKLNVLNALYPKPSPPDPPNPVDVCKGVPATHHGYSIPAFYSIHSRRGSFYLISNPGGGSTIINLVDRCGSIYRS